MAAIGDTGKVELSDKLKFKILVVEELENIHTKFKNDVTVFSELFSELEQLVVDKITNMRILSKIGNDV